MVTEYPHAGTLVAGIEIGGILIAAPFFVPVPLALPPGLLTMQFMALTHSLGFVFKMSLDRFRPPLKSV